MDAHELIALCAPRPTFISYGMPEKGDAKWLDHQGSYMATVAAGPVFRLLGAKDLGASDDYQTEKMPAVNAGLPTANSPGASTMADTPTVPTGSTSSPGPTGC